MKSSTYLFWITLIIASLLLGACVQQVPPAAPVEEAPAEEAQEEAPAEEAQAEAPAEAAEESDAGSIAVILTGPWDDNSWNEAGYNAVHALEEDGVKIAFSENVADADVGRL